MKNRRVRGVRLRGAVLLLLGVSACRPAPPPVLLRAIEPEPHERLAGLPSEPESVVFDWPIGAPGERERWQVVNAQADVASGSLRVRPANDDPQLIRAVDLEAESIHAVEVTLAGLEDSYADLFWRGPGQTFSEDRRIRVRAEAGRRQAGGLASYSFRLHDHPGWAGRIEALRLDPTARGSGEVAIEKVRGLRWRLEEGVLDDVHRRAWRVDVDGEVRSAWLAAPGHVHTWEVEIPELGELALALALPATVREPVEFRVTASPEDGAEHVVFQRILDPARGEAGHWHTTRIPLDMVAGRRTRLRFETRSAAPLDPLRGIPAWGNPMILRGTAGSGPPNVVIVVLDTLRADHLSAYGYTRSTSPEIDAWARSSAVLFRSAIAPAPWTLPSHASLFSGLDALRHGVNHEQVVPESTTMLAEQLQQAGYLTAAVTGGGFLDPTFGLTQGFDVLRYWNRGDSEPELKENLAHALDWLERNRDVPFFLFFHTYEIHAPHRKREPYFHLLLGPEAEALPDVRIGSRRKPRGPSELVDPGDHFVIEGPDRRVHRDHASAAEKALAAALYDSAIAYADHQVGRLLEQLRRPDLVGRTLIILTSDHGEALGERDRAGHGFLAEYNLHVPLIVQLPDGSGAGQVVEDTVSLVDVVPTALEVVGLKPQAPLDGRSLVPLARGEDAPAREAWSYAGAGNRGVALRDGEGFKYVYNNSAWSALAGRQALYDLRRDPEEHTDLAPGDDRAGALAQRIRDRLARDQTGIRLQIRNGSQERLVGTLRARDLRDRLKLIGAPCGCVGYHGRGVARVELGPASSIDLLLEGPADGSLALEGELASAAGARSFREKVELAALDAGWTLAYRGGGWQSELGTSDVPGVGFHLWRSGIEASGGGSRAELHDQLRALGYLDE